MQDSLSDTRFRMTSVLQIEHLVLPIHEVRQPGTVLNRMTHLLYVNPGQNFVGADQSQRYYHEMQEKRKSKTLDIRALTLAIKIPL